MIRVGVNKAIWNDNSEKRPSDRVFYRYIDSWFKLIVVLLKTFDLNKHEFMSKVFDAIFQCLDADHSRMKSEFNQAPYYRIFMYIFTATNRGDCFNSKTQ